jgi:hypothetical protein
MEMIQFKGILHIKRDRIDIDVEEGDVSFLPNLESTERSEKNLWISKGPVHEDKVK